jgi:hypothetical protein
VIWRSSSCSFRSESTRSRNASNSCLLITFVLN